MYNSEDLEINYSENMAADEKDRYIRSLIDKINMFELDKRAKELAVEEKARATVKRRKDYR